MFNSLRTCVSQDIIRQDQDQKIRRGRPDPAKIRSLILLLGSDNADLVVRAVHGIIRCLHESGHTLDDLTDLLEPPKSVTHREIARRILKRNAELGRVDLAEHELAFLEVMARSRYCSDRQAGWLERLYCKFF